MTVAANIRKKISTPTGRCVLSQFKMLREITVTSVSTCGTIQETKAHEVIDFPFKSLISNTTSSTVESRPAAAVSIADARHWIASVLSPPEESIH